MFKKNFVISIEKDKLEIKVQKNQYEKQKGYQGDSDSSDYDEKSNQNNKMLMTAAVSFLAASIIAGASVYMYV